MRSETQEQASIVRWLEANGFVAVRIVAASKAGVSDIVACTPKGAFLAVEVKREDGGKVSPLQQRFLQSVTAATGTAFVVSGYTHFLDLMEQTYPELFSGYRGY